MMRFIVLSAICLGVSFGATPLHAQLFSPGALHRQHSFIEGISNCLKCHEAGNRLSDNKCLKCHAEIAVRRKKNRGYHGGRGKKQPCYECHRDHRGLSSNLIVWKPSKSRFPHNLTGWVLSGKHKKANCKKCHQPRRLKDTFIKGLLKHKNKKETFLGLGTSCRDCHFDEHRGQIKGKCSKCHTAKAFAPAKPFSHTRHTRFRLTGKHRRVKCIKCHSKKDDTTTLASAFPAPVEKRFAEYRPIRHNRCTNCHRDPHKGARGRRCESCHTTKGWGILNEKAMDVKFHRTTKFPLEGAHISVKCKTCHGPFRGQKKAIFKGLAFGRCDDCHFDAHVGQFDGFEFLRAGIVGPKDAPTSSSPPSRPDCRQCHTEQGFRPALFEIEDHGKTDFELNGSHRAVSCRACHKTDKTLLKRVSKGVRRKLKDRGRPIVVSRTKLSLEIAQTDCKTCHDDVHDDQFSKPVERKKECAACHREDAFLNVEKFEHNRDSTFKLENKHAEAACTHCHLSGKDGKTIQYRGTQNDCASCHVDIHAGQFVDDSGKVDCARCHVEKAFLPASKFDHQDKRFSSFLLRGRHLDVECLRCHPKIGLPSPAETPATEMVQWFKGVPKTCAGCHADQHRGAFDTYIPASSGESE